MRGFLCKDLGKELGTHLEIVFFGKHFEKKLEVSLKEVNSSQGEFFANSTKIGSNMKIILKEPLNRLFQG